MKHKQKISFLKKSQSSNTPIIGNFRFPSLLTKSLPKFFAKKKEPEFLQTKESKFCKQKEHRNGAQFLIVIWVCCWQVGAYV